MDPATHDLRGNAVDGWYWLLTKETFQDGGDAFQCVGNWQAAEIIEHLAATTDDIPAQVMADYQEFWNVEATGDGNSRPELTYDAMMAEIGSNTFAPASATAFAIEFLCRMTGTRAS
jgi:hypothetical protein